MLFGLWRLILGFFIIFYRVNVFWYNFYRKLPSRICRVKFNILRFSDCGGWLLFYHNFNFLPGEFWYNFYRKLPSLVFRVEFDFLSCSDCVAGDSCFFIFFTGWIWYNFYRKLLSRVSFSSCEKPFLVWWSLLFFLRKWSFLVSLYVWYMMSIIDLLCCSQ